MYKEEHDGMIPNFPVGLKILYPRTTQATEMRSWPKGWVITTAPRGAQQYVRAADDLEPIIGIIGDLNDETMILVVCVTTIDRE